jgi:hypothetical protein
MAMHNQKRMVRMYAKRVIWLWNCCPIWSIRGRIQMRTTGMLHRNTNVSILLVFFISLYRTIPNDQTQKVVKVYRCFLIFR